jgi:hypothetical protein
LETAQRLTVTTGVEANAFACEVLVLTRDTARGRTSGAVTEQMRAHVLYLYGGNARAVLYWERDRALADLGLEEG